MNTTIQELIEAQLLIITSVIEIAKQRRLQLTSMPIFPEYDLSKSRPTSFTLEVRSQNTHRPYPIVFSTEMIESSSTTNNAKINRLIYTELEELSKYKLNKISSFNT